MQQPDSLLVWKKMLQDMVERQVGAEYRTMLACHEAGHAVAAFLLGEEVLNIRMRLVVRANGDVVLGMVETGGNPAGFGGSGNRSYDALSREEKDILERNIMVTMAGEAYVGTLGERVELDALQDDLSHVEKVIEWMFEDPEEGKAYRQFLAARLAEMFDKEENRRAAAALSGALRDREEMSGEEAELIIRRAMEGAP